MATADHHYFIRLLWHIRFRDVLFVLRGNSFVILALEMRILVIGGGGREHALAWRLAQTPGVELYVAPGNTGISKIANVISGVGTDSCAELAESLGISLTVVGPEAPLVAGIVNQFRSRKLAIVGPTQAAARLEGSKVFAKEFFKRAGIPTAQSANSIGDFGFPVVIKADGLAGGKGVVIAGNRAEAEEAFRRLGPNVVIEEYLEGEEVSFIGLSNGREIVPFLPTQDHKRLYDGDKGPNTGGMGAYVDARILTDAQTGEIMDRIMLPTLAQMNKEGTPFTGFLYAGLMMTAEGPKVLEFNARLGDPETQVLMHSFEGDLAAALEASVHGGKPDLRPKTSACSVCVVAAAQGYPEQPRYGDLITGIEECEATGATVFHAGTTKKAEQLMTSGGRVLGVTAKGETLQTAISNAYRGVEKLSFDGMQYRTDIGQKGLRRW
jgi:phosphoribosylamine--glycine ligase